MRPRLNYWGRIIRRWRLLKVIPSLFLIRLIIFCRHQKLPTISNLTLYPLLKYVKNPNMTKSHKFPLRSRKINLSPTKWTTWGSRRMTSTSKKLIPTRCYCAEWVPIEVTAAPNKWLISALAARRTHWGTLSSGVEFRQGSRSSRRVTHPLRGQKVR